MRSMSALIKSFVVLVAALGASACEGSPLTPDELEAAQASQTHAMLAEVLDKLDLIEQRIDSLEATVTGTGGAGLVLTGLPAAQLDSVLVLASYLAEESTAGSWEACGNVEIGGEFGIEWKGEAEGEGAGHLGAWAGTGAYAGGKLTGTAAVGGGFKLEGAGGVEFCYPLGAGSPPVRPVPSGPMRAPALDDLRATLTGLTSQFNLTPATLTASLDGVSSAIAAPGSLGLQNLGSHLPLPTALAGMAADPLGTATSRVQGLLTSAQSALCSGSGFGGSVSTVISQACGVISSGGMANFTVMADIANTYPAVENAIGTVCSRVNAIGLQRLVISSWDVTFPLGIGTVNVFPGYNQRLFPSYAGVSCP